jgi:hypothetical protein
MHAKWILEETEKIPDILRWLLTERLIVGDYPTLLLVMLASLFLASLVDRGPLRDALVVTAPCDDGALRQL